MRKLSVSGFCEEVSRCEKPVAILMGQRGYSQVVTESNLTYAIAATHLPIIIRSEVNPSDYFLIVEKFSENETVQRHYVDCLANGCSKKLAGMLAARKPPAINGDPTLLRGHLDGNEFTTEHDYLRYRSVAERGGVSVRGKRYMTGLARFPGDPQAWISDASDVRKICREKNLNCEGVVRHKAREPEEGPKPDVQIADDIVAEEVDRVLELEPEKRDRLPQLVEEAKDRLTPEWKKP